MPACRVEHLLEACSIGVFSAFAIDVLGRRLPIVLLANELAKLAQLVFSLLSVAVGGIIPSAPIINTLGGSFNQISHCRRGGRDRQRFRRLV